MADPRSSTGATVLLGCALAALGALSVASRDFAFQWQPVPSAIPHRPELAAVSGAVLEACAAAMVLGRGKVAALPMAIIVSVWAITLQLPRVLSTPLDFTMWLGLAETSAMAIGAWAVVSARALDCPPTAGPSSWVARSFGLALLIFGASHFLYARFTAVMVPGFLPFPLLLAYLTGAVHAGTGLLLIAGLHRRLAASVEAAMMASFALLVHLPRVFNEPASRLEWTMLLVALALTGSAWMVSSLFTLNRPSGRASAAVTSGHRERGHR